AERNPAADVEGADACRKICILASLACGMEVKPEFVKTEGITKITLQDVSYANSYGCVIKLIARAKFNSKSDKDEIECIVSPAFVKKSSQLASIDDVYNGVLIRGNATGDVVFYGKGAGKLPTASAVVGDIIDIAKNSSTSVSLTWEATDENIVADYKETQSEFYVRLSTQNKDAEKEINHVFDDVKYITCKDAPANEYAFVTKKINEAVFARKLVTLAELDCTILGNIRLVDY
ncbi:MAG: homoserine dehydrogenase, partial [Oscillospiraceae bacterium]